jgi:hypothetical protein
MGDTTRHDCIGFLGAKHKSWDFYINFYDELNNEELSSNCEQFVSILSQWNQGISATNRLFILERQVDESDDLAKTELFFKLLHLSTKSYNKKGKSIWPQFICRQMIIEYLSYLPDVELLLEYLLDKTITRIDAEKTLFPSDKKKALKKILRLGLDYQEKYNMKAPIIEKNGMITLEPLYRDCIDAMSKSEGGLTAYKKLNPLVEYLQPLASTCEYLKTRAVDQSTNSLWGYFDFPDIENEKLVVFMRLSNENIGAYVRATISINSQQELVTQIYDSLNNKLGSYFNFELITDGQIKDRDATSFSLKKKHNNYALMSDPDSMAELHEKLSQFFSIVIGELETELKK